MDRWSMGLMLFCRDEKSAARILEGCKFVRQVNYLMVAMLFRTMSWTCFGNGA
jgi:hypothetical protein